MGLGLLVSWQGSGIRVAPCLGWFGQVKIRVSLKRKQKQLKLLERIEMDMVFERQTHCRKGNSSSCVSNRLLQANQSRQMML